DVTTLQHHCRGLAAHRPELLRLYRVLGEYTLDLATARGGLSARQNEALRALLAGAAADFEPHDS
ncbi:MAG: hypothetical protein JJV98_22160, partial [Desulfosarcina sp.]|nr:hypothetical protein [Desulfobacterales bacterium]